MTNRFRRTPIAALAVSLLIGGVSNAIAQGMLLQRGESGVAVSGGYYSTKDLSGFAGTVGYSFRGIVDLGVSVERSAIDARAERRGYGVLDAASFATGPIAYPTRTHPHVDATAVCPSVVLNLRGPDPLPSLVVCASYEHTWFSEWWDGVFVDGDEPAGYIQVVNDPVESGTSLGAAMYRPVCVWAALTLVPRAGLAWERGKTTVNVHGSPYRKNHHQTSNFLVFPVGVHMLFRASSGMRVHVSPEAELGTGGRRAFSVSTGIVMTRLPFIGHVR